MKEQKYEKEQSGGEQNEKTPVDKKRIALLNGRCGQSDRIRITGQIVDVPITAGQKLEEWDPILSLPLSLKKRIRPVQDFGMSTVRRARLHFEIFVDTGESIQKLIKVKALHVSENFTSNSNGFFNQKISKEFEPGNYFIRMIYHGTDSLRQSVSDLAYARGSDSLILKKDYPIGVSRLRILPLSFNGIIITSDIDQTFLDTGVGTGRGLLETMFEEPVEKKPLPGMAELFREIYRTGNVPIFFISASPHFYRRSLASVLEILHVNYTGLNLKYMMNTLDNILRKSFRSIMNIEEFMAQGFSRALERGMKFISSSLDSLFDHISYKLSVLLENRLAQPTAAREILIGDNTESDCLIFALYQILITAKIRGEELENYLYRLRFRGREGLTRDSAINIVQLVEQNIELHGAVNSVQEIWINLAVKTPEQEKISALIDESLPSNMRFKDFQAKGGTEFRFCRGALGMSLAAFKNGLIEKEQLNVLLKEVSGKKIGDEMVNTETIQSEMEKINVKNYSEQELEILFS